MESKNVYEVRINTKTYEVVSANTAFYAFVGNRLYYTFDKLLENADHGQLAEYMAENRTVLLNLVTEEGESKEAIALITMRKEDDLADIRLLPLDRMKSWERQIQHQVDKKNHILGLYGDYFFEYDVKADNVRVYAADKFEQNVLSVSFAEFEKNLMAKAEDTNREDIKKLIATLRCGSERFIINTAGDILNIRETAYTLFKGISFYEEGVYVYATGYVHLWNGRTTEKMESGRAMERDYLTGVLTKAEITNLAINTVDVKKTSNVTLAIIDIDFFKKVNDVYGHMVGDEVLKKVASVIEREVKDEGIVGRFGGDEFLVIFYDAYDMENMRERLRSIKNTVSSTFNVKKEGDLSITLSIGCAAYPKDADNYGDLFFLADFALYRAKEKGRDRYIIYDREKHGTLEEIKNTRMSVNTLNSRGDMSPAELVCAMMDRVYGGEEYELQALLDDIALNLNIQRVLVYASSPHEAVYMGGGNRLTKKVLEETRDYLDSQELLQAYDHRGMVVVNNVRRFESSDPQLYEKLRKQGIISFVHIKFQDKNGVDGILSLEYVNTKMNWNQTYLLYYRLLAKLLSEYVLEK